MSNNRWGDKISGTIQNQIKEYERKKYVLSEDEIKEIMPKVIDFYNNHPEDQDVFRTATACILYIQTPEKQKNKENKITNKPKPTKSNFGDEQNFLWSCTFRIWGRTELVNIFGTEEQWKESGLFNQQAFIFGQLKVQYSKIGAPVNPKTNKAFILSEASFLDKYYGPEATLEDVDDKEYRILYSTNIFQVIR